MNYNDFHEILIRKKATDFDTAGIAKMISISLKEHCIYGNTCLDIQKKT